MKQLCSSLPCTAGLHRGFRRSLPAGPFQAPGDRVHIPAKQPFLQASLTLLWPPLSLRLGPPAVSGAVDRAALALFLQTQPPCWAGAGRPRPPSTGPSLALLSLGAPSIHISCPALHPHIWVRRELPRLMGRFRGCLRPGLGQAGLRVGRCPRTSGTVANRRMGRRTTGESKCWSAVPHSGSPCVLRLLSPFDRPSALTRPDPFRSKPQGRNQEPWGVNRKLFWRYG